MIGLDTNPHVLRLEVRRIPLYVKKCHMAGILVKGIPGPAGQTVVAASRPGGAFESEHAAPHHSLSFVTHRTMPRLPDSQETECAQRPVHIRLQRLNKPRSWSSLRAFLYLNLRSQRPSGRYHPCNSSTPCFSAPCELTSVVYLTLV